MTKLTGMSRMSSSCCWMRCSSRSSGPSNEGSVTTYSPSRGPASAAASRTGEAASAAREAASRAEAAPWRAAGAGVAPALPRPLPLRALAAPALEPLTPRP
ncbi:hypothetical protein [Sorangium sp. So ce887]|uniref:hypothetical protein n=1 Tax=Sorangium sp. So ce887 TaxID=3133324 RepID=UPI003F62BC88